MLYRHMKHMSGHMEHTNDVWNTHFMPNSLLRLVSGFDVVKQRVARIGCYRKVKLGVRQFNKDNVKEKYWEKLQF